MFNQLKVSRYQNQPLLFAITAVQNKKDKKPKDHAILSIPQANLRFQFLDAWEWRSVKGNMAIL